MALMRPPGWRGFRSGYCLREKIDASGLRVMRHLYYFISCTLETSAVCLDLLHEKQRAPCNLRARDCTYQEYYFMDRNVGFNCVLPTHNPQYARSIRLELSSRSYNNSINIQPISPFFALWMAFGETICCIQFESGK